MEDIIKQLSENELFGGITKEEIGELIQTSNYSIKSYKKGEIIASEDDECNNLGLVIEGTIEIQRIYSSGKYIVLQRFNRSEVFGEVIVFSKKNTYPATVIAVTDCRIFYIKKEDIVKLCAKQEILLSNFMSLLSNKILMLNRKIKSISLKSVKHKVIDYILEQRKMQKSDIIKLKLSKEQIASMLGIPRPSLSRELMNLRDAQYIEFNRDTITILNIEDLEEELFD